jgi:glycosyltransferase involved in cell wall biosynthesis
MRIWAFPSIYPYEFPGMSWSGIFAHRQYKALQQLGADISVVQPVFWHPGGLLSNLHDEWKGARKLNYPDERVYDGITVYHPRIANMKPSRFFGKAYQERYVDAIVGLFKKKNIIPDSAKDIFYSQWIPEAGMAQAAARRLGIKSAVLIIGDDVLVWPHTSKGNLDFFKTTIEQANGRFAVAKYLGNEANKLLGTSYPFEAIRRGANYDTFTPVPIAERPAIRNEFGIPGDKIVILSIGSPIVRKGWLDLFDALQAVKKVNDNFVLAAAHSGPKELELDEEVAKRGLQNNFINLGEVAPQKINRLYNTADIFCLPSHWEGIANSVVEAMASGLPVITTNVCGHPEVIQGDDTGILIPPKQPQLLAEKLLMLINDSALREQLGKNARTFITGTWGNFADNAAKLHSKLEGILGKQ